MKNFIPALFVLVSAVACFAQWVPQCNPNVYGTVCNDFFPNNLVNRVSCQNEVAGICQARPANNRCNTQTQDIDNAEDHDYYSYCYYVVCGGNNNRVQCRKDCLFKLFIACVAVI